MSARARTLFLPPAQLPSSAKVNMKVLSDDMTDKKGAVNAFTIRTRERGIPAAERRQQLAQELQEQREDEVLDLHARHGTHLIDNAFSLVTANMAVVSMVLGLVYMSRTCDKPLAGFLIVLGMLAPFAACLPVLLRQWFYLHLRLRNVITVIVLAASAMYVTWLLVGQRWAFKSSAKTCDPDLTTATNVVVFMLYLVLLIYAAKVTWYLLVRVRYSYKQLVLSCFQDPYPNALAMSEIELDQLDMERDRVSSDMAKPTLKKNRTLMTMQRHQHEVRQNLHRIFQSRIQGETPRDAKVKPITKAKARAKNSNLDLTKPRRASSKQSHVVEVDRNTKLQRNLDGLELRELVPAADAATREPPMVDRIMKTVRERTLSD